MSGRPRPAPLTRAARRVLADLAAREGEVLIHKPRQGIWQCGHDGVAARWQTFTDLERTGLIAVRPGFAMAVRVQITDAGRAALTGGAASQPPQEGDPQ